MSTFLLQLVVLTSVQLLHLDLSDGKQLDFGHLSDPHLDLTDGQFDGPAVGCMFGRKWVIQFCRMHCTMLHKSVTPPPSEATADLCATCLCPHLFLLLPPLDGRLVRLVQVVGAFC